MDAHLTNAEFILLLISSKYNGIPINIMYGIEAIKSAVDIVSASFAAPITVVANLSKRSQVMAVKKKMARAAAP